MILTIKRNLFTFR